jgi:hypothetical protein
MDTCTAKVFMNRGIKQGDPLSPLIYILVMDMLHARLRKEGSGYQLGGHLIVSEGFADDTALVADSWISLKRNNELVLEFCKYFSIEIQHKKTVLTGRLSGGRDLWHVLEVPNGKTVAATSGGKACKYLGVWIAVDGGWADQIRILTHLVEVHCAAMRYSVLNLEVGIRVVNEYLMPKLEYRLAFMDVGKKVMKKWQKKIDYTIKALDRGTSNISTAALVVGLGMKRLADRGMALRVAGMVGKINNERFLGKTRRLLGAWPRSGIVNLRKLRGMIAKEAKPLARLGLTLEAADEHKTLPGTTPADAKWTTIHGEKYKIPRMIAGVWDDDREEEKEKKSWNMYVDGSYMVNNEMTGAKVVGG